LSSKFTVIKNHELFGKKTKKIYMAFFPYAHYSG